MDMATAIFDNLKVSSLERTICNEYWINSTKNHTEGAGIVRNVFEFLKTRNADAVSIRMFGKDADTREASRFFETKVNKITCPPLCILQNNPVNSASLNIQVHAISGANVKRLYFQDKLVGQKFEDKHTKFYMLNVLPDDGQASEYTQTKNVFEKAHEIFEGLGLNFSNTIRIWLFAQNILSWYDQLNKARGRFFEHHNIHNQLMPASTAIGVTNLYGKALAAQFLAVSPENNDVTVQGVNSPLQCQATDYKSSFSRAVKLHGPDYNRLYISGTASIDKTGKTVFVDDARMQLEMTMQVVKAILNEADMDWSNTVRSLVYFKNRRDFGLFDDYCRKNEIILPHIKIQADICRDNLLFELELDAASVTTI